MLRQASPLAPRGGFFRGPFQRAEEKSRQHAQIAQGFDWKVAVVLVTTAVSLTIQEYVFKQGSLNWLAEALDAVQAMAPAEALRDLLALGQNTRLADRVYWAVGTLVTYVAIPVLIVKLLLRERLRDYGLRVRGIHRSAWAYLAMLAVMVPLLWAISHTQSFQAYYPFYKLQPAEPLWPRFWIWEMFYVLQFFALEFFFRGFLLHGLRPRFGFYAIFVMTVPYCMIHFGKPLPETFAAIAAGIVLGFMSLKTWSIWLGAAIHVAVALGMDFLSLWHKGFLG